LKAGDEERAEIAILALAEEQGSRDASGWADWEAKRTRLIARTGEFPLESTRRLGLIRDPELHVTATRAANGALSATATLKGQVKIGPERLSADVMLLDFGGRDGAVLATARAKTLATLCGDWTAMQFSARILPEAFYQIGTAAFRTGAAAEITPCEGSGGSGLPAELSWLPLMEADGSGDDWAPLEVKRTRLFTSARSGQIDSGGKLGQFRNPRLTLEKTRVGNVFSSKCSARYELLVGPYKVVRGDVAALELLVGGTVVHAGTFANFARYCGGWRAYSTTQVIAGELFDTIDTCRVRSRGEVDARRC
jgi:hypothetical protein